MLVALMTVLASAEDVPTSFPTIAPMSESQYVAMGIAIAVGILAVAAAIYFAFDRGLFSSTGSKRPGAQQQIKEEQDPLLADKKNSA